MKIILTFCVTLLREITRWMLWIAPIILFLSVIHRDFSLSLISLYVVCVSCVNVIAFLWHKTDWGWLVLSWLLWSSHSLRAAGTGGGTDYSSKNWQAAAGKKKEQPGQRETSGRLVEIRNTFYLYVNQGH